MKKMKRYLIVPLLMAALAVFLPAFGSDVIPSKEYPFPDGSGLPEVLNVGVTLECGDYTIRLAGQPVISKSMHSLVGDYDMKYMIIRVALTYNGEEPVGWLTPDSFGLQEIYRNRLYGSNVLDPLMSAKSSSGFKLDPFYGTLNPGKVMYTPLVFDVCPEAEGWIFTFTPHVFGEEPGESIKFRLPQAMTQ
jgi:hypothetical protein